MPTDTQLMIDAMVKASMDAYDGPPPDAIVCMRKDAPGAGFADDLFGTCMTCGVEVRYRPYMPKAPKLCVECTLEGS